MGPDFAKVLGVHRLHPSMNICTGCDWRATPNVGSLAGQHDLHRAAALTAEYERWLADVVATKGVTMPHGWAGYRSMFVPAAALTTHRHDEREGGGS